MEQDLHTTSMDTITASLCEIMGINPPEKSASPCEALVNYANSILGEEKADRVLMFNPDAIADWIYRKYPSFLSKAAKIAGIEIPLCTVMPSVTPVCFATMYTGVQPEVHGIQTYAKPVLTIETIFDALIKQGKKPVIIASKLCSVGNIFLERNMDYFLFDNSQEVNAKAAEIIIQDKHDFVVVYNGNYDAVMHKQGPENPRTLAELRANDEVFAILNQLVVTHWKNHNTLVGFAMDHGCHEIDDGCGSHGLAMPEDLNVTHFYKAYKAEK